MDTSAYVPLLIDGPSTAFCQRLWNDADAVATSRLLDVESAAALAQGLRLGRLTDTEHAAALHLHSRLWCEVDVIEADGRLVERAAELSPDFRRS